MGMPAIATMVEADPYLSMPAAERLCAFKARRARFDQVRIQRFTDMALKCLVAAESPLLRDYPFVPPIDYSGMWFLDLVEFGERWQPSLGAARPPTIEEIQRAVADLYKVKVLDLKSSRRTADVVRPRQVAFYLCKQLTSKSLPEMGRRFGGRDHTTAIHAIRKISALVEKDEALRVQVNYLTAKLGGSVG